MARTAQRELDERKGRVLGFLEGKGAGTRPVSLSYSALSDALGTTECRVRCSLKALRAEGMVRVSARHLPNGGQRENAYRVTSKGLHWLALVEGPPSPDGGGQGENKEEGKGERCRLKRTA